jgi:hypothetical protein
VHLTPFGSLVGGLLASHECVVSSPNGRSWSRQLSRSQSERALTFPDDFAEADTDAVGLYKVILKRSSPLAGVSEVVRGQPFSETSFEVRGDEADD